MLYLLKEAHRQLLSVFCVHNVDEEYLISEVFMNTAFTEKELNENYLFLTQLAKTFPTVEYAMTYRNTQSAKGHGAFHERSSWSG